MLETFYRIIMKTRTGKKLYLREKAYYSKVSCSWEFIPENAIWFETEEQALKFCKEYFKNFANYEVECFKYYI